MTKSKLNRWLRQAETINEKAAALFDSMEKAGVEQHDGTLHALCGDMLCSSAELANVIEGRISALSI
jgi:hypothetical protein